MKKFYKKLLPIGAAISLLVLIGSKLDTQHARRHQRHVRHKDRVVRNVPATIGHTHFVFDPAGHPLQVATAQATQSQRTPQAVYANKAYFAPDDDVRQKLLDLIHNEQEHIRVAIYTFTDKEVAQALCAARADGVQVEVVTDPSFLSNRYTKIGMLHKKGVPIYIYDSKRADNANGTLSNLMHNKFVIFERNKDDSPLVWTGSFNFTKSARLSNQENVVILHDQQIIEKYEKQFKQLKERSMRYQ